ncbi:hypothetical protein KC19_1G300400 [Ceratodon purpureus]|uniref:Uncharacterized protein n=1 Tax=Ceratodon purpureus TaxID=3225 RepID=A0A8T0JDS7_CERPU|nr:hypothetical protein KC19_1G300400 [Ceratodon purpureus]
MLYFCVLDRKPHWHEKLELRGTVMNLNEYSICAEIEGLKRKLTSKLAPTASSIQPEWQIGECAAMWWRPNFETLLYPYQPPHITKPKVCSEFHVRVDGLCSRVS